MFGTSRKPEYFEQGDWEDENKRSVGIDAKYNFGRCRPRGGSGSETLC
jgi:hypothetical protein